MKKIITTFLVILTITSIIPMALATNVPSFSDVPTTHWAFNEIEKAVDDVFFEVLWTIRSAALLRSFPLNKESFSHWAS